MVHPSTSGIPCRVSILFTKAVVTSVPLQRVTGNTVELAHVDQGYSGPNAAAAAQQHGIRLEVIRIPHGKTRPRVAAPMLGGRTKLRLGRTLSEDSPGTTNGSPIPSKKSTS